MVAIFWIAGPVSAQSDVETLKLTSRVFGNTRTIRVLLPPGYHDPNNGRRKYPVFYFNDGIIVFKSDRIGIEEVVHRLIETRQIPPIIVVGIDNGGSTDQTKNPGLDRANEYLPYPDAGFPGHSYTPELSQPIGQRYPEFLIDEVMPLIQGRYRVARGARNTGLGGFSYGGVAALFTAMSKRGMIGKLLLESTPLWIGSEQQLLRDARAVRKWPSRVYIGLGTSESPEQAVNAEGARGVESLRAIIAAASRNSKVKIVKEDGAKHEPPAWRGRLPEALRFLFAGDAAR